MSVRAYELLYPREEDVVVILVEKLIEVCAYVRFLEFNKLRGMLLASELSKRKIRSLSKIIKIGKTEIVMVIRVNSSKGSIDVSKRQMIEKQIFYMEKKWSYGKYTNSFANCIANHISSNYEDLKIRWMWLFYRKYQHGIRGIIKFIKNSKKISSGLRLFFGESIKFNQTLKALIKINSRVRVDFELILFSKNGLISLKKIFGYCINLFKKKIEIKTLTPCTFSVFVSTQTKKLGIKIITSFLLNITKYGGLKNGKLIIKKTTIR